MSVSFVWQHSAGLSHNPLQEQDKYMSIYAHYLRDEADSEISKVIRNGRAIP